MSSLAVQLNEVLVRSGGMVDAVQVGGDVAHRYPAGVRVDGHIGQSAQAAGVLGSSTGVNVPARSRGTRTSIGPTSVCTVLGVDPLREFPELRPAWVVLALARP